MPELDDLPLTPEGLQKFASSDQEFFLGAAGDMIRHFCGWHISPSLAVTGARVLMGEKGLIALPTLYLTSIEALTVDNRLLVHPHDYEFESCGIVYRKVANWPRDRWATMDYTHGYDDLPRDVAAIGYELALQAMSRPGANAKDMGAGPYRVTLLKLGIGLDQDQKSRLWEAGVVRSPIA